jgi:hypothetical protein
MLSTTLTELNTREWILNIHDTNIIGVVHDISKDGHIWYKLLSTIQPDVEFIEFRIIFEHKFIVDINDVEILKSLYNQNFITNMIIDYVGQMFSRLQMSKINRTCIDILDILKMEHINYIIITCTRDGWNYTRLNDGG